MVQVLTKHAYDRPGELAVVDEHGATTWERLNHRANQVVHALRHAGVKPGATVAALLPNRREYAELLLAAQHAGFACVLVNWQWVADEVAYVLDDADAVAFVADVAHAEVAAEAAARVPAVHLRVSVGGEIAGFLPYEELLAHAPHREPGAQEIGGPMFYTSGTTGRPKGVRQGYVGAGLSPAVLELISVGYVHMTGTPIPGVTLLDGPLYHSAQWAFSMFPLMAGSTVLMRRRFDPAATLDWIDRYGVTNVHLVPTQLIRLLKLPDEARRPFRGDTLKLVLHGAAPCPPEVKRLMIEWWGPIITEYYGGTEGGVFTMATSEQWLSKPGTLGPCVPTKEIVVVDDAGNRLGPGETGTLYVKDTTGQDFEYHKDAHKTEAAHLEPGLFTLGDVGFLDEDGWLFLSDRKIDMVISGGVNIYPAEIESVLVTHPSVRDVAVFGIPDDELGEQVKAAVEVADGVEASAGLSAELLAFCRTKLAAYKVPRSIDFVPELPRQATGKLYKRLLRDPYWAGSGRTI